MKSESVAFLVGVMVGVVVLMFTISYFDKNPLQYYEAAKPALVAAGIDSGGGITATMLSKALNPCIVDGQLPDECKKYVVNGVLTQPPIKIVIDTTK